MFMTTDFGKDYELIDSGDFEKLERFGPYRLRRPEPQAIWPRALSPVDWQADAWFKRSTVSAADRSERGEWLLRPGMPDRWTVAYNCRGEQLCFRLGMTSFKHVGLFPEQASNWDYIYEALKAMPPASQVLNLFAYTGGATLAARAAGAEVIHLDAVRQVVSWASDNLQLSGLNGVHWLVEDAMNYVRREARRGKRYQGIILDPPAYGRGPKGEKWILEEGIAELMAACARLLDPQCGFVVLNLYSMGFSASIAENLLRCYFPYAREMEKGELCMQDRAGRILPLSVYARFKHITC